MGTFSCQVLWWKLEDRGEHTQHVCTTEHPGWRLGLESRSGPQRYKGDVVHCMDRHWGKQRRPIPQNKTSSPTHGTLLSKHGVWDANEAYYWKIITITKLSLGPGYFTAKLRQSTQHLPASGGWSKHQWGSWEHFIWKMFEPFLKCHRSAKEHVYIPYVIIATHLVKPLEYPNQSYCLGSFME